MIRKFWLATCLLALLSTLAFAGDVPFSGSGQSGTLQTGQEFAYNYDNGYYAPDFGIPGVGAGLAIWNGPTVTSFTITFDLPTGVVIDPTLVQIGQTSDCVGGYAGGTAFCAQPYTTPWTVQLIGTNELIFTATPGNYLTSGDPFFFNVFFDGGDPSGASFSGSFTESTPEPSSILLMGSGLLGMATFLRRRKM
jgi:PEP-CTERM motif